MAPLTKQQKLALMNDTEKMFRLANVGYIAEQKKQLLDSDEKSYVQQLAAQYVNYRSDHLNYISRYKDIKIKGFERISAFFLDLSGTPEAEEKNREFLNTLTTDEGCAKFAKRCASEIMTVDLRKCVPSKNIEDNVRFYADNAHKVELCWVLNDLLGEKEEYLNPEVRLALKERKTIIESVGDYQYSTEIAASKYYPVMPEMSDEDISALIDLEYNTDDEAIDMDSGSLKAFSRYLHGVHGMKFRAADQKAAPIGKICEMEKEGKITPYTYAKDENGNRLELHVAAEKMLAGQNVTFAEDEEAKPIISSYIRDAEKQITMPEKGTAAHDAFGSEALSAQGRGFKAECARLSQIMDGAKLWYTGGSDEFKNISRILKATAAGDNMPNRDESLKIMNEVLENCRKYVEDEKHTGFLKAHEQKRLNAVKAVRESLLEKREFLIETQRRAETEHLNAEMNGPGRRKFFHVSEQNQTHYHVNDNERNANRYLDTIRVFKGEDGFMRELALETETFIGGLSKYAEDKSGSAKSADYLEEGIGRSLAKIAIMELVRDERAGIQKKGGSEKGSMETRFDAYFAGREDNTDWIKAISSIAGTETVRKLADSLRESPENAAAYLAEDGQKKLLDDVKGELKQKYAINENRTENTQVEYTEQKQVAQSEIPSI